jgi:hypothetical protein
MCKHQQRIEFTFRNLYVIIGLLPNTVIFWIELSCWSKRYSNKVTLLLSNSCKHSTVVITGWLIVTKSYLSNGNGSFPLSYSYSPTIFFADLIIWATRRVSFKKQEIRVFASTWVHPSISWVCVAHLFCLCSFFVLCSNLANVSGLSFLDCVITIITIFLKS